jgi:cytochrome c biogenesis protein CcmG, thiol:disulfide interchange protein DsbE
MTTNAAGSSSSKGFILAVVAVIIAGIAGVAYLASNRSSPLAGDPIAPDPVTIEGAALAPMPEQTGVTDAITDPSFGAVAPTLTGTNFVGDPVSIKADGRAKVVYFVAHWCPHCQREVPLVEELIKEGSKPDNLDLYAVSTSVKPEAGNYPPQAWLDQAHLEATIMRDDKVSSALVSYGGGGFPFAVYLDTDNKVIARSSGELGKDGIVAMWQQTVSAPASAQ